QRYIGQPPPNAQQGGTNRVITALPLAAAALPAMMARRQAMNPATATHVHQGLSTRQKVVLLAGAAALYWLYKRHQSAQGEGSQGRYYRSRNGRIYYRDPRTHQAIWVTPPPASRPIAVPADQYQRYVGQPPPNAQ